MDKNILRSLPHMWHEKDNTFWIYGSFPDPKTGCPIGELYQVSEQYFERNVYPYLNAVLHQRWAL